MKKTLIVSILLGGMAFTQPARAGFMTGNQLYSACTAEKNDPTYYQRIAQCQSYVTGALDMLDGLQSFKKLPVCLTSGVTVGQVTDITIKYLREHPEKRNYSASSLVFLAANEAFGCQLPA